MPAATEPVNVLRDHHVELRLLFFENAEARNDVTITTTMMMIIWGQWNGMLVNWPMMKRIRLRAPLEQTQIGSTPFRN
jgi:hypothetical protein